VELGTLLSGPAGQLGFGGVAGMMVGYASKKVTKLVALALGLLFITVQGLVYLKFVSVDWNAVQQTAAHVWRDAQGVTLADRVWDVLSANLPFGGGFAAGFAIGFRIG
jgi:uncharacterized membrane protein (Fun14 family)